MIAVYIAVMNNNTKRIKVYTVQMLPDYSYPDIEDWLHNNIEGYNDCDYQYMSSTKPIKVEYE